MAQIITKKEYSEAVKLAKKCSKIIERYDKQETNALIKKTGVKLKK